MKSEYEIDIDALSESIPAVCESYNVHGKVVERRTSDTTAESEYYIVVGMNGIPTEDPKKIISRIEQSYLLFYPHAFALKIDENSNALELVNQTVKYCTEAQFVKAIFNEFNCEIPKVMRVDELYSLDRFNEQRFNEKLALVSRERFHNSIQEFFKKEKSKNPFTRAWRNHRRSGKYDKKASIIGRFINFFRRKKTEVSLKTLHQSCDTLKMTTLNEIEYKHFKKQVKREFPDIMYAVSDKQTIDHGVVKTPEGVENPFGESVTFEEYFERRKKHFTEYGFDSVRNLNVAYWEFRDITFRASDEADIASVVNPFRYSYIQDNLLSTVEAFGPSDTIRVPAGDMMNFYSLAMTNNLPFYMDHNNLYGEASLEYVNVVYSQASQATVDAIMNRLISDKITGSHMISDAQQKHLLSSLIDDASKSKKNERKGIIDLNKQR